MSFILYHLNESLHVSDCALYDIIKMTAGMCLCVLYMILLKLEIVCV